MAVYILTAVCFLLLQPWVIWQQPCPHVLPRLRSKPGPVLACPLLPRVSPRSCSGPRLVPRLRKHVGSPPATGGDRSGCLLPSPAPSPQACLLAASTGAMPCGPRASLARESPTAGWGEAGGGMTVCAGGGCQDAHLEGTQGLQDLSDPASTGRGHAAQLLLQGLRQGGAGGEEAGGGTAGRV